MDACHEWSESVDFGMATLNCYLGHCLVAIEYCPKNGLSNSRELDCEILAFDSSDLTSLAKCALWETARQQREKQINQAVILSNWMKLEKCSSDMTALQGTRTAWRQTSSFSCDGSLDGKVHCLGHSSWQSQSHSGPSHHKENFSSSEGNKP